MMQTANRKSGPSAFPVPPLAKALQASERVVAAPAITTFVGSPSASAYSTAHSSLRTPYCPLVGQDASISCHETPKRSFSQAYRELNGYVSSGISTCPPSDSFANSSSTSRSVSHAT